MLSAKAYKGFNITLFYISLRAIAFVKYINMLYYAFLKSFKLLYKIALFWILIV
jgi:hypothetical protein